MALTCNIPIQAKLDELYSYNKTYGFLRQPAGTMQALLSAENQSLVDLKLIGPKNGKTKQFQYTYINPDCTPAVECNDASAALCAAGTSETVQTATATINDCKASGNIELTVDEFRDLCNIGPNEYFMKQLMGKMDMLIRGINADVIADVAGGVGCFSTGVTDPRELALINPTTGIPNWGADTEIMADFMDAGMTTTPLLIGGREVLHYMNSRRNGGLNDQGVNMGAMGDFPMFYDNQLETVAGVTGANSAMFAVAPQVVAFVNWLDNAGDFQSNLNLNENSNPLAWIKSGDTFTYSIIQDPKTGLIFDLDAVFDACAKKWFISIRSKYNTIILPLTQCYADCFTGILKYAICPAPSLACPA